MAFAHLHVHDEYSALDGYGSPERYVAKAKELGLAGVAITNHGNIDSAIKWQKECKNAEIPLAIGCELYVAKDLYDKTPGVKNRHMNAWVKNDAGWRNLLTLLTIANVDGFYRKPRIDGKALLEHLEGLVISSACSNSFTVDEWGRDLAVQIIEQIEDDFYFEIMPHDAEGQIEWNKTVIQGARSHGRKLIATNDCHYPDKDDAVLQELLLAVNSAATWNDPKRWRFETKSLFMASEMEMLRMFKLNHPGISRDIAVEAMDNTMEIIEKCHDFKIEKRPVDLPLAPIVPAGENEEECFRRLIQRGFKEKQRVGLLTLDPSAYQAQIDEELALLIPRGFTRYFLIVAELMRWCKENDIAVGPGRGSAAGCVCAWFTGITQVDPLKYELLFFRFQDPERTDLPDIDLDFEQDRRQEVIEHIRQVYGDENVVQISTYMTMKGRSAIHDVARVFEVSRKEVSEATKFIDDDEDFTLEAMEASESQELRGFCANHHDIMEYAVRLKGTLRGYGKHAAGVCISQHNLINGDHCNLVRRSGVLASNWDKDEGEYMGLMKLDVLGLTALSRMKECVNLIKENYKEVIDFETFDMEDAETLKMICVGDTVGIFQLGTHGLKRLCVDLRVDSFKDVYNATALFRPGPLGAGLVKDFIERKNGKQWKSVHPKIDEFTAKTQGIIVYQEQVMLLANQVAGFSWAMCNKMRKVIAKSKGGDAMAVFEKDFIEGCQKVGGISYDVAKKTWDDIVYFSAYSFNLSHSLAYSVLSMRDAILKRYYPGEFYASCLSYLDEEKRKEILDEAIARGFQVCLPKFGLSKAMKWGFNPKKAMLTMPYSEINGVGERTAQAIYDSSKMKRKTFFATSASNIPAAFRPVLNELHASDPEWMPDYNEAKKLNEYFKYNLLKLYEF